MALFDTRRKVKIMKKFLMFVGFLFLFLPALASADFSQPLRYGIKNSNDVKQLQQFLIDQGDYAGPVTGNFYSLTQKAIKVFQKQHALKVTGVWDTKTYTLANNLLASVVQPTTPVATNPNPASNNTSLGFMDGSAFGANGQQTLQPTTPTVPAAPAAVDLCRNIALNQSQIPMGMYRTTDGDCLPIPAPTPAPSVSTPAPTTAPTIAPTPTPSPTPAPTTSLLLPNFLKYGSSVSWPNGNNYGDVNDSCNNCVTLITNMPTTATIHIMPNPGVRGGSTLDSYAASNSQSISGYADSNLSTTHVFLFGNMNMDKTKTYLFIVDATDQAGNKYVQQFGGVDANSNYLPGPFKWGENQTISWSADYPSQYMKSNYYVDAPLTSANP